ncbi:integrase [Labrenzia sp. EL_126]|nr:integrase [Labrenzia sp. EL_126]
MKCPTGWHDVAEREPAIFAGRAIVAVGTHEDREPRIYRNTGGEEPQETRQLIERIDTAKIVGLRDRALIGLMVYSFARIGAALSLKVEDVYTQKRRLWVRLSEKSGKQHDMPCHHNLDAWLHEYLDTANLWNDRKGYVFCTIDRDTKDLSDRPLPQANAYAMIRRRARQAGIKTPIGSHVPGNRHHGLPQERRVIRKGCADGQSCFHAYDAAL